MQVANVGEHIGAYALEACQLIAAAVHEALLGQVAEREIGCTSVCRNVVHVGDPAAERLYYGLPWPFVTGSGDEAWNQA